MNYQILLVCFFFLFGTNGNAQGSKESLRDSIVEIMNRNKVPGMFLSVVTKDSILLQEGLGMADVENQIRVTDQHLFRVGSITKSFTAMAIMNLVADELLDLDTPLREIAPEIPFTNPYEAKYPILIKHLLEHKTGFDDMHLAAFGKQRNVGMTAKEEMLVYKNSFHSRWEPGLVHSYSNPGYFILGYLIEKISGVPYQEYIQENILQPLNMHSSSFTSEGKNDYPKALGYDIDDEKAVLASNYPMIGEAAGALLSNAEDMSIFLQYMLSVNDSLSHHVLNSDIIAEMEKLHGWHENKFGIQDGYALGIYDREYGASKYSFKGHSGGINGFLSDYIYSRELDLGIAISSNAIVGHRKILNEIVDHMSKDVQKKFSNEQSFTKIKQFHSWAGTYALKNTRNEMLRFLLTPMATTNIHFDEDTLIVQNFLSGPEKYIQSEQNGFRKIDESKASIYLTKVNNKNHLYLDGDLLHRKSWVVIWSIRILLALGLILGLVFFASFIIQGVRYLFKKASGVSVVRNIVFSSPVLCFVLSVLLLIFNMGLEDLDNLGKPSLVSISIFLFSLSITITAVFSLVYIIINRAYLNKNWKKIVYGLASITSCFLALYCIYYGWAGIRIWLY